MGSTRSRTRASSGKGPGRFWTTVPGILAGLAALITATGGLLGGLAAAGLIGGGADGGAPRSPTTTVQVGPMPIVARITNSVNGASMHGFFTPKGFLVAPGSKPYYEEIIRRGGTAVWTVDGIEHRASVSLVKRLSSPPVVLLRVDGPAPRVSFAIRDAVSLQSGDRVWKFLSPGQSTPGQVIKIIESGELNSFLVTTGVSTRGDAGTPLIDGGGRVVAMIVGRLYTNSDSLRYDNESVTIEAIRLGFPDAF